MGKKKGKKKSKAQLAQEATDLLAVGLDRAQLSVNNAGPGEDVAVLKLVIEKKKAAFAKGAQRPSEELLVRSRAAEEPPPGLKKIETKEILAFLESLPKAPPPGQEPEVCDWSYVPTEDAYEWTYAAIAPKKKEAKQEGKKSKKGPGRHRQSGEASGHGEGARRDRRCA